MNRVERHIEALRELLLYEKPWDFCPYNILTAGGTIRIRYDKTGQLCTFRDDRQEECLLCISFIDNERDGYMLQRSMSTSSTIPFVCPCYYYDTKQEAIDRSWLAIEAWEDRYGEVKR